MPFAPECFWAFQTRATFWAIFEKFSLVPPLHFFRKCRSWVTLRKLPKLGHSGRFGAAFCAKPFFSLCIISGDNLQDNDICARVLLAFWSEGYFLGDFWKTSLGLPFALFLKMRVLGDLPKIAITWPFGHFLSRCVRLNLLQSLHFKCMLIRG